MEAFKAIQAQRVSLCDVLAHIIAVSDKKFLNERAKNNERRAWARLVVTSIEAYAKLLELSAIEDLSARVERLEETRGVANVENVEK